jgi:hypothetical protein
VGAKRIVWDNNPRLRDWWSTGALMVYGRAAMTGYPSRRLLTLRHATNTARSRVSRLCRSFESRWSGRCAGVTDRRPAYGRGHVDGRSRRGHVDTEVEAVDICRFNKRSALRQGGAGLINSRSCSKRYTTGKSPSRVPPAQETSRDSSCQMCC